MPTHPSAVQELQVHGPRYRIPGLFLGFAGVALLALVAGGFAAWAGEPVGAFLGLGIAVTLGGGALPFVANHRAGRMVVVTTRDGLVLPGGAVTRRVLQATAALSIPSAALLVWLWSSDRVLGTAAPVLVVLAAMSLIWIPVGRELRRWRPAEVQLTRSHVHVSAYQRSDRALPWGSVRELPRQAGALSWMLAETPRRRFPEQELRSDPLLVAHLVEFYRVHPELRGELHDDRVLERLRDGSFQSE